MHKNAGLVNNSKNSLLQLIAWTMLLISLAVTCDNSAARSNLCSAAV